MSLESGTIVGDRYRVLSQLGEGAMGAVYVVEHVHMANRMAMKVLKPDATGTPTLPERFAREARSIAKLDHPGIVRVTDFGNGPHGLFMVMELVDGVPLSRRQDQRMTPVAAIDTLDQILAALEHAHGEGVVHRDLKPDNVMTIAKGGRVSIKVLDFGLAKLSDAKEALTREGMVFGTPRYMAPEQATGEAVDQRADLYAAGIILYELVNGAPPFDGASMMEVLKKQIGDDPPPLSLPKDSQIDVDRLWAAIQRALEKDPNDRFPDAASFRAALAECRLLSTEKRDPVRQPTDELERTFIRAQLDAKDTSNSEAVLERTFVRGMEATATVPLGEKKGASFPLKIVAILSVAALLLISLPMVIKNVAPDPLKQAEAAYAQGDLAKAKTLLAQVANTQGDLPVLHLWLGKIAYSEGDIAAALVEYNRALLNDGKLASDADFQAHTRALLEKDRSKGSELLKLIVARGEADSAPFLAELARTAPSGSLRRLAYEGVERLTRTGLLGSAYLLTELEKEARSDCEIRRWYVKRLVVLDDPGILPALKRESGRRSGFLNLFSASECMRSELDKGIERLGGK